MKKIILLIAAFSAVNLVDAQLCCNVVSANGQAVVTANGLCVVAANSLSEACTADTDGDGVLDTDDKCPSEAGDASNDGCPTLSDDEKTVLKAALEGVKFKTDSDELLPESDAKLDKVYELLSKHPDFKLKISGYTDNTGDADYNKGLSDKRAKAAKGYLVAKGIAASRITATGYGEANPVADNATAEGRAKNRRVEFDIVFD